MNPAVKTIDFTEFSLKNEINMDTVYMPINISHVVKNFTKANWFIVLVSKKTTKLIT